MLSLEDIQLDVNYDDLCFLESHLMHEVKRRGSADFVKTYSENIEEFRRDWSKIDFCFLLALLEYLDKAFSYDESIKLDKYVADYRDFIFVELDNDLSDVIERYDFAIPCFLKRGFIYSEIEEAV